MIKQKELGALLESLMENKKIHSIVMGGGEITVWYHDEKDSRAHDHFSKIDIDDYPDEKDSWKVGLIKAAKRFSNV